MFRPRDATSRARIAPSAWTLLAGQSASLFGSSVARFGIAAWVYERTGSISAFSTIAILAMLPGLIVSPWAGALVDRWPKRLTLVGSDIASALGTTLILVAALSGAEDGPLLWAIYVATAISSIADAFQWPALSAAVTNLVPPAGLGRFNGFLETARSLAQIGAPAFAGLLYGVLGLGGLVSIELGTCLVSCVLLLAIRIDEPARLAAAAAPKTSLREDVKEGFRFVRGHFGLKYLLGLFTMLNFFASISQVLHKPFDLSILGAAQAGTVQACFGIGMAIGGALLGATGGPRRKATFVAVFAIFDGLLMAVTGTMSTFVGLALCTFAHGALLPWLNGCSQTVWQVNTPIAIQGRVFAVRRMFAWMTNPLSYALAAPIVALCAGPLQKAGKPLLWPAGDAGPMGLAMTLAGVGLTLVGIGVLASGKLAPLDATLPGMEKSRENQPRAAAAS